jgi:hypothetical protein
MNIWLCTLLLSTAIIHGCDFTVDKDEDAKQEPSDTADNTPISPSSLPKIELSSPLYEYIDSNENTHIFGILTNIGNTNSVFVKTKCSFYNYSSSLIEEETSYVIGTSILLSKTGIQTNTALKPNESGYFHIWPTIEREDIASYNCNYTYDIARDVTALRSKLVLNGPENLQENALNRLEYLGSVKNNGSIGLTFGKVYLITRDQADSIIDIDSTYINGETVLLSSIDSTTDTALSTSGTGTFSGTTSVDFSDYGSHSMHFAWRDSDISNGAAKKPLSKGNKIHPMESDKRERYINRRDHVETMHSLYLH